MVASIEFDVPGALRRVGGDRELLARIIDFVAEDSPEFIRRMEIAFKSGEYSEVERAAHSLKGLVSNLHCRAVQDKALEIEGLAHRQEKASIPAAIANLSELTEQMMLKIDELRHSLVAEMRAS